MREKLATLNLIAANAISRALDDFPQHAGATAALFGVAQFGFGALATMVMGQWPNHSPVPMAALSAATGVLSWSAWHLLRFSPGKGSVKRLGKTLHA